MSSEANETKPTAEVAAPVEPVVMCVDPGKADIQISTDFSVYRDRDSKEPVSCKEINGHLHFVVPLTAKDTDGNRVKIKADFSECFPHVITFDAKDT